MSRSPMPGAIVPVSSDVYGTSRRSGPLPSGIAGGRGRNVCSCCAVTRVPPPVVSSAGRAAAGGGAVWVVRPRSLSQASCSLPLATSSCSHPEVATVTSAHSTSGLRRIASLQREKDAGAVETAEHVRIATLRMRHDPYHVPARVADTGNIVRRTVRILCDIPQDNLGIRLKLGRRLRIGDISAVPMCDGECQLFPPLITRRERRVGGLHANSDGTGKKLQPGDADQRHRLAHRFAPYLT